MAKRLHAASLLAKPSRSKRLTDAKAAKAAAKRAYQEVCRLVNLRDHFTCVACDAEARPGWPDALLRGHHHHITFRSHRGADTTANLCLLCPRCHADVHEHRLTITGNADRKLVIRRVA